jgi:hypothetical protein
MVTSYSRKDLVKFAKFIDSWAQNGMLLKDEGGRNIINEQLIDNWLLSLTGVGNPHCPKVVSVTQELLARGTKVQLDRECYEIAGISNTAYEAQRSEVLICAPWVNTEGALIETKPGKRSIVFAGKLQRRPELSDIIEVKWNGNDIPFVSLKVPHMQFPVYENGHVIAIGVVVHSSDF